MDGRWACSGNCLRLCVRELAWEIRCQRGHWWAPEQPTGFLVTGLLGMEVSGIPAGWDADQRRKVWKRGLSPP